MGRNTKLLKRIGPPKDAMLDKAAWAKTQEEVDLQLVTTPVYKIDDLPEKEVCVVPRHAVWEQHGMATEPSQQQG